MDDFNQKLIPKKSFLAVTKQLHLNRDRGFEDEFKVHDIVHIIDSISRQEKLYIIFCAS